MLSLESVDISDIKMRLFLRGAVLPHLQRVIFRLFARNDLILLIFVKLDNRDRWGLEAGRRDSAGTFISLKHEFWLRLYI